MPGANAMDVSADCSCSLRAQSRLREAKEAEEGTAELRSAIQSYVFRYFRHATEDQLTEASSALKLALQITASTSAVVESVLDGMFRFAQKTLIGKVAPVGDSLFAEVSLQDVKDFEMWSKKAYEAAPSVPASLAIGGPVFIPEASPHDFPTDILKEYYQRAIENAIISPSPSPSPFTEDKFEIVPESQLNPVRKANIRIPKVSKKAAIEFLNENLTTSDASTFGPETKIGKAWAKNFDLEYYQPTGEFWQVRPKKAKKKAKKTIAKKTRSKGPKKNAKAKK